MLSVASLSSAGQASSYYSKDNYYTAEDAQEASAWFGTGAAELGLAGPVDVQAFEDVLKGDLPGDNSIQKGPGGAHRPGMDMTFSAPKSVSLLAYVGGDTRLLGANMEAVKETLAWAEKNLAETRVQSKLGLEVVQTGKLVVALFQHDTSRNLDPQAHVHAVIANATQTKDGSWRALRNDKLWEQNSLMGSIYHAFLREKVEDLGYETEATGKHGTFEVKGVTRETIEAFSTRRQEALEKAGEFGIRSAKGMDATILRTRAPKAAIEDRPALYASWKERAQSIGADLGSVVDRAHERSARGESRFAPIIGGLRTIWERGAALASWFAGTAGASDKQPYYIAPGSSAKPRELAAAQSVSSAIEHLSEREAAFSRFDIARAALHLGLPTTITEIEKQVGRLERADVLLKGENGQLTTASALSAERAINALAAAGKGRVAPIVADRDAAGGRVQALAGRDMGFILNPGQESAARLLLASSDRTIGVQGVAGAGKSSVLRPVAIIAREEGRQVLGLGVQNKLVAQLKADTGIDAVTVAKFIRTHEGLLDPAASPDRLDMARTMFRGSVILVDESSMLANKQAETLARLAEKLEVGRLAFIGDTRQLGAVEAGKPFEVLQARGLETALMSENIRARDPALRGAAQAANDGKIGQAFAILRDKVVEAEDVAGTASGKWLALAPEDRNRTLLMTSGRTLMGEINDQVQAGLKAEGSIGEHGLSLTVLDKVNATRAEQRSAATYEPGMKVELRVNLAASQPQRIGRGWYDVERVNRDEQTVTLKDDKGQEFTLEPRNLPSMKDEVLRLAREREIEIHEGDKLRWTDSDKDKGLLNAETAKVKAIDDKGVTVTNTQGVDVRLETGDPMLERLDLGYAMNTHQLQGATTDRLIAAGHSKETNLSNARLFLVNITRPRDDIELVVDNADRYAAAIARNPGDKTAAMEAMGELVPSMSREELFAMAAQSQAAAAAAMQPQAPSAEPAGRGAGQPVPAEHPSPAAPAPQADRPAEPEPAGKDGGDREIEIDIGGGRQRELDIGI